MAGMLLVACCTAAPAPQEAAAPLPTPLDYTSDSAFREAALDAHNFYRAQHNVSNLVWNDTLADSARRWSEGCVFEHSDSDAGENLANGYANTTQSIEAWALERMKYNYNKPGFDDDTGHFTQLVWASTSSVGCGRTACDDEDNDDDDDDDKLRGVYVVCEYWPKGNVIWSGKGGKGKLFEESVQRQVSGDEGDLVYGGRIEGAAGVLGVKTGVLIGQLLAFVVVYL